MPINLEWYRSVASMLSPESKELYWQIVGSLDKLTEDDEMRIIADASAATTASALQSNAATVKRLEEMWHEINAMLARSETNHSDLAALLAALIERLDETYGHAMTRTRVLTLMQTVRETVESEFNVFLDGLSTKRLREFVDEVKRGEQSLKDIASTSRDLRHSMTSFGPSLRGAASRLIDAIKQYEDVASALPTTSKLERYWPSILMTPVSLVGMGLAFWVGRHMAVAP